MSEYIVEIADNMWAPDLYSFDKSEIERIVRCKDCKHFEHCRLQMISNKPDGFCAWGERKVVE